MNAETLARGIRMRLAGGMPEGAFRCLDRVLGRLPAQSWQVYWNNVRVTRVLLQLRGAADLGAAWTALTEKAGGRYCRISRCYYQYQFWNTSFFREIVAEAMGALCSGYVPVIDVRDGRGGNIWETFLVQPFLEKPCAADVFTPEQLAALPEMERPYGGDIDLGRDPHADEAAMRYWRFVYARFFRLNERTARYAAQDRDQTLQGRTCCGVLGRGTDYVKLQSSICYRQPTMEQLTARTREMMEKWKLEYVYLATEDSTIAAAMRAAFPGRVLENRRTYYDAVFREKNLDWIGDVHFDREDDEYRKGVEYLSSLCILVSCPCLVAGRCGGSEFADMLRAQPWQERFFFDLGRYEDRPEEK